MRLRNSFLKAIRRVFLLQDVFFKMIGLEKRFPVLPNLFKVNEGEEEFYSLFKISALVKNMNPVQNKELPKSFIE